MDQTNSNINMKISNLDNPNIQVNEKKIKDKRTAIYIIIITSLLIVIFCAIYFPIKMHNDDDDDDGRKKPSIPTTPTVPLPMPTIIQNNTESTIPYIGNSTFTTIPNNEIRPITTIKDEEIKRTTFIKTEHITTIPNKIPATSILDKKLFTTSLKNGLISTNIKRIASSTISNNELLSTLLNKKTIQTLPIEETIRTIMNSKSTIINLGKESIVTNPQKESIKESIQYTNLIPTKESIKTVIKDESIINNQGNENENSKTTIDDNAQSHIITPIPNPQDNNDIKCNIGYFIPEDDNKKECQKCSIENCEKCYGTKLSNICSSCINSYEAIYENSIIKSCDSNCEIGEEDKCLTCDNNKCSSCNIGYKLLDGKCIANYTIKANYHIDEDNLSVQIFNAMYYTNFVDIIVDGKHHNPSYYFTFPSPGNHTIYFTLKDISYSSLALLFGDIKNLVQFLLLII